MQNKHAIKLLVALLTAATLSACNGGSATTSSTNTVTSTSPLQAYINSLAYTPATGKKLTTGGTQQQSFTTPGARTINSVTITYYSGANCTGTATTATTLQGPVTPVAGTYTSTSPSNYALCSLYPGGCNGLFTELTSGNIRSLQYTYNISDGNEGVLPINAACMYNQLAQPTPQSQVGMEGVANWSSPNSAIACTVSSPCGFSQGYASNFNHYAYILSTESIVILSQNLLEGTLTPISYTPTLGNSVSMLNSLDGKYIYVADGTANKIQIFGVNTVDGSLNLLNEVNTGTQPNYGSLSFDPAGKFLYSTATSSDNVSVFAYAESSGNLTLTQQIASGTNPYITTFTPDGKYAYITNSLGVLPPNVSDQAYISMFAVESSSGHLTPLAIPTIQSLANSPFASLIDPGGRYLYVTNTGGISAGVEYAESTVSIYDIDDVTGQLSYHVGQESFVVGTAPTAIIADPLYKYMYVANALGSSVSMMNINAVNGNLTGLASIDSSGIYPGSMAFGPGSKYLYVVNAISNTVQIFLVNHTTGELSQYDNPMPLGITAPKMSAYIIFGK